MHTRIGHVDKIAMDAPDLWFVQVGKNVTDDVTKRKIWRGREEQVDQAAAELLSTVVLCRGLRWANASR